MLFNISISLPLVWYLGAKPNWVKSKILIQICKSNSTVVSDTTFGDPTEQWFRFYTPVEIP